MTAPIFVPIDQAARDAIRTLTDRNLGVEAGAGTGKTSVLVSRVAEILRSGRATVDEIAVITFTEAAAAELAGRIRQELEGHLADVNATPEQTARVREALGGLHRAHIETIHAFAGSLLRERPVEARIDPGFEMLDELAAGLQFDAAYRSWQHDLLAGEHPELVRAVNRGFGLKELRRLAEAVNEHRGLLPLAPLSPLRIDLPAEVAAIRTTADTLRKLRPLASNDEKLSVQIDGILAFDERVAVAAADEAWLERVLLDEVPKINKNAGAQRNWADKNDCVVVKATCSALKDALADLELRLRSDALVGVLPFVEAFVAGYEEARRAAGKADFDDLLIWARRLLLTSPEALGHFRERFRVVLIDEFQDTDPVQAGIALLLAGAGSPELAPGTDPLTLALRDGALTVVGDPKQSIYRFRGADIAVYDAIRNGPLAGGDEKLVQNFRSNGRILAFANTLFDRVLTEEAGVQPANTELVACRSLADESRSVVVVHGELLGTAEAIRTEEARLVAATIRLALDEGWLIRDRNTSPELERPLTPGDIAILVPARTQIEILEDALTRLDIPFRNQGGKTFFQRQEVRDLTSLLAAVDDPLDQVSLLAALRSEAFACTDDDIYLYVTADNKLDYRHIGEVGPETVREALAVLRDLHDARRRLSLARLVRLALEQTRLIEIALTGRNGNQAAANLVSLAEQARAFSSAGGNGLRGFVRWLRGQMDADELPEAPATDEAAEAVSIVTMHGSKGLEYPCVLFANIATKPSTRSGPIPDRTRSRLHLSIGSGDYAFTTPDYEPAKELETIQRDAERKRLLYVAVTRARDYLVVPVAAAQKDAGVYLADLLPSLPGPGEAGHPLVHVLDADLLPELPPAQPPTREPAPAVAVAAARAARATWEGDRATTLRTARQELGIRTATGIADEAGPTQLPAIPDETPLIVGSGRANEVGDAVHQVLERVGLDETIQLAPLVEEVAQATGLADRAAEIEQLVAACLSSDAARRARAASACWQELPYTLRTADGFETGRIDLVFREGDHLVVVDWKTDTVTPGQVAAAAEGHRPQAEAYVRALTAATPLPVAEVIFVFPRAPGEQGIHLR